MARADIDAMVKAAIRTLVLESDDPKKTTSIEAKIRVLAVLESKPMAWIRSKTLSADLVCRQSLSA